MGLEYGLYEVKSKKYISMGKRIEGGFQMKPAMIAKFISDHPMGVFEIYNDAGNVPEEIGEGWVCIGSWDD